MPRSARSPSFFVRFAFISAIVLTGIAQTWANRHYVNPDGISYAEIASAYLRHDWPNAVSTYWSPLYSWLLAAAWGILHTPPYWQLAIAHTLVFFSFLACIPALELLLRELLLLRGPAPPGHVFLPEWTLLFAAYSALYFAGLGVVGMIFCSPDSFALGLTLLLSALVLRIARTGGSNRQFVTFGILCAIGYFARAAFLPIVLAWLAILALLFVRRGRPPLRPLTICAATFLLSIAPFLWAISHKAGHFTIGDTGRLNYAWEVGDVTRWIHWQGGPPGFGQPIHPTHQVLQSPSTFTFAEPVSGTYPPWYDPAYWYAGLKSHASFRQQSWMLIINLSVALNLLVRSPIFLPALLLFAFCAHQTTLRIAASFWPVWIPAVAGIALYCLIFVEKRYVAANLLILWLTPAVAVTFHQSRIKIRRWASLFLVICCSAFLLQFFVARQVHPVKLTARDLFTGRENEPNVDFLIAQRLHQLGVQPGDKVAYIGPAIRAEWARLGGIKIVAEVPLIYHRVRHLLYNGEIDDPIEVTAFWNAPSNVRDQVLRAFRSAGAKAVIDEGFFDYRNVQAWHRILPRDTLGVPAFDPEAYTRVNSRYRLLAPNSGDNGKKQ